MRYVVEVNGEPYGSFIDVAEGWHYAQRWCDLMDTTLLGFAVSRVEVVDILNGTVEFSWQR